MSEMLQVSWKPLNTHQTIKINKIKYNVGTLDCSGLYINVPAKDNSTLIVRKLYWAN